MAATRHLLGTLALFLCIIITCCQANLYTHASYKEYLAETQDLTKEILELLKLEIQRNIPIDEINPGSILTRKQMAQFRDILRDQKRNKRSLIFNFAFDPDVKWPATLFNMVFVPYKIDPGSYSAADVARVKQAIASVEQETCIRFTELDDASNGNFPQVEFRGGLSCLSFVGRSTFTVPQAIFLSSFCRGIVGYITHELLNTLGMWNTHQRQDRDQYVIYNEDLVIERERFTFVKIPESVATTLNKGYDFWSIMHFNSQQFLENGLSGNTLTTIDPLLQRTIGQRVEMSFNDSWTINEVYCKDICSGSTLQCLAGGYPDPNNCNQCKCPDGYSGTRCELFMTYVGETCGGTLFAPVDGSTASIQSPGYPSGYNNFQECTWNICVQPNTIGRIEFWFSGDFSVYCFQGHTCFHWVEVRYGQQLYFAGPRFCCQDFLVDVTRTQKSFGECIIVLFRTKYDAPTADLVGFNLNYRAVDANNCPDTRVCTDGQRCDPGTGDCVACPPGWTGTDCLEDIDECAPGGEADGVCQNGAECINFEGGYYCDCADGFAGLDCSQNIDECLSMPCMNGGTCVDLVNSFQCSCSSDYSGILCNNLITSSSASTPSSTTASTPSTSSSTTAPTTSTSTTTETSPTTSTSTSMSTTTVTTTTTQDPDFPCVGGWVGVDPEGQKHCCEFGSGGEGSSPRTVPAYQSLCKTKECELVTVRVESTCSRRTYRRVRKWWRWKTVATTVYYKCYTEEVKCDDRPHVCHTASNWQLAYWDNQRQQPFCAYEGFDPWSEECECCGIFHHVCTKCPSNKENTKYSERYSVSPINGVPFYTMETFLCTLCTDGRSVEEYYQWTKTRPQTNPYA